MVSNRYGRVKKLIDSLSTQEFSYFKRITKASSNPHRKQSKMIMLLESLKHYIGEDDSEHSKNRKLFELLEDRILDNLLSDVSLDRIDSADNLSSYLKNHKKFLKAQVLHQRSIVGRAYQLAGNCAQGAIEVEDFSLAIRCYRFQLRMISYHQNEGELKKLLRLIDQYEHYNTLINKALRLYHELKQKRFLKIHENMDLFIEASLKQLKSIQTKLNSKTIDFVNLYFEKEEQESLGYPERALILAGKLKAISNQFQHFQLPINKEELHSEVGRLHFETGNTVVAKQFILESMDQLPLEVDSGLDARELIFLIEYFNGTLDECRTYLYEVLKSGYYKDHAPDSIKRRWKYYECCFLFRCNDFQKCLNKTNDLYRIGNLEVEQNLNARIIKSICLLETDKLDMVDREVDSLRKYIQRNKLQEDLENLCLHEVFNLLWQLRYCGYHFNSLKNREIQVNEILENRCLELSSKPLSFSLNPLNNWLQTKNCAEGPAVATDIDFIRGYYDKQVKKTQRSRRPFIG